MQTANKILKKQTSRFLYVAIQGFALLVLGVFVGYKLLTEGIGKTPQRGKSAALLKTVSKIVGDKADPEQVLAYLMAALMGVVIIFGVYYFIKGLYHMLPKNTVFGKSILGQAKGYEKFSDIVASINTDLGLTPQQYENVYIGREWIVGTGAMRLSNVKGVFWLDGGEFESVLCCVDEKETIWAESFTYQDVREDAIKYLRSRYPELKYGNVEDYRVFLGEK